MDAAIAVAAALSVTEPCSTGLGGDAFLLYADEDGTVHGLNGSGRSSSALTQERIASDLPQSVVRQALPTRHGHTVTVPGAAALWCDALTRWGSLPMAAVVQPSVQLAEEGFPVAPLTAHFWATDEPHLRAGAPSEGSPFLPGGRAPRCGEVFRNPHLAELLRSIGEHGKDAFYAGPVAAAIVEAVAQAGGALSLADLAAHTTDDATPISVRYRGVDVYELPPNGQGLVALLALQTLKRTEAARGEHNGVDHLHALIESLRLAFADGREHIADPDTDPAPLTALLSDEYADSRAAVISRDKASPVAEAGTPIASSDTVCFEVVDSSGRCCSFVNSNYMGFGTGIVPSGCGFALQNRGANFTLAPGKPNSAGPSKRPYNTIIPSMLMKDGALLAGLTLMGGFMQPQGHVQMVMNMLDWGMGPQEALDQPRVCLMADDDGEVCVEDGVSDTVIQGLQAKGHRVRVVRGVDRALFGRGQIILRDQATGVLHGGSDGRADGCAVGF